MQYFSRIKRSSPEALQRQFDEFRRTRPHRSSPFPEHLWKQAVELARETSIAKASKTLQVCYADLKRRVLEEEDSPARSFVEISLEREKAFEMPQPASRCVMELESRDGMVLRVFSEEKGSEGVRQVLDSFMGERR